MKKNVPTWVLLIALAASSTPSSAAVVRHEEGSVQVIHPADYLGSAGRLNPDFLLFQFQEPGCQDHNVGTQMAVLDLRGYAGHKIVLKMKLPSSNIVPYSNPTLSVGVGFGQCQTADAFEGTLSRPCPLILTPQAPCFFSIPQGAQFLTINRPGDLARPVAVDPFVFTADFSRS